MRWLNQGKVLQNNSRKYILTYFSLNNLSEKIRWSMDFRWQRADKPVGFYGLKEGLVMKTSKDPNHVINWQEFEKINRNVEQIEASADKKKVLSKNYIFSLWLCINCPVYRVS